MSSRKKSGKVVTFIVLLVVIIGAAFYAYSYLLSFSGPTRVGEGEINTKAVKRNTPVNLLLLGVDIGDPKSKSADDPKRTDTIMLINYNPIIDEINMVSIPRDTLIKINGKNFKINSAHAIGGVNYTIKAVSALLDLDINYYGKVDYEGFRQVIDAVGGVDVKINRRMDYDDASQNLSIHFKKGEIAHLNGEKAEEFFRWRKNNDGTGFIDGDIGRIGNQHMLIENVIDKIKSPACTAKVLPIIPQYVETNMKPEEIIRYGYIMAKTEKDKINITTLKGDTDYIDDLSYFIYDAKQNTELLNKLHVSNSITENN